MKGCNFLVDRLVLGQDAGVAIFGFFAFPLKILRVHHVIAKFIDLYEA